MTCDLIFFPDYRAANPYQRLLYERLAHLHPSAGSIDDALSRLDQLSPEQQVIFHLHWEDVLHRHLDDPAAAARTVREFLTKLADFTDRGGTFVWTVHNLCSHIAAHPVLDGNLRAALAGLADRVHVHSLAAAAAVRAEFDVDFDKLIVLPHGNYRPVHDPRGFDRDSIRNQRGWHSEQIIVLLFGRLDGYKGGAELLTAFAAAPDNLHLVVAGKQIVALDSPMQALPELVRERIDCQPGFVPEREVGRLFCAVDAVVLPYRSILTSGTLMLALTLGRPVIAPDLPAIREVVADGREGLLYPPQHAGNLAAALSKMALLDRAERDTMAEQAHLTGALYDWAWIGRQFGAAMIDAACHGRAHRRRPRLSGLSEAPE